MRATSLSTTHPIDYSPTGKKITYTNYDGTYHDTEIYTIKVGGGGKTNVTDNKTDDFDSSYSPNAKRIAYAGWDGHDLEIYTINASGTGKFQLTKNGTNDFTPSYSPDGKKIAYSTGNDIESDIYTINVGGGGKSKVTEGSSPSWGSRP